MNETEGLGYVIKAGKAAYKRRGQIKKMWEQIYEKTLGRKVEIAFTGMPGVGKTVLFDYVSGNASEEGGRYIKPFTSFESEKKTIKIPRDESYGFPKKRVIRTVIPGTTNIHLKTLEDMFERGPGVDGIIHVVCNGFVEVRIDNAVRSLINEHNIKTVEAFRKYQMDLELEDLKETCRFIQGSIARNQRPSWMIIVVAKVDLYHCCLDDVLYSYSPDGDTDFSKYLSAFSSLTKMGDTLNVYPVCCCLEDFTWNEDTVESEVESDLRYDLVENLIKVIGNYC